MRGATFSDFRAFVSRVMAEDMVDLLVVLHCHRCDDPRPTAIPAASRSSSARNSSLGTWVGIPTELLDRQPPGRCSHFRVRARELRSTQIDHLELGAMLGLGVQVYGFEREAPRHRALGFS